jgi:Invasin, domain 3/Bacterial Ig-like domain (group 3)/Bacterial Ig-like domain (group 1)
MRIKHCVGRSIAVTPLAVMCVLLGGWLLAPAALAAGPATTVDVQLSPSTIVADGTSTTTATATVTDIGGNPVAGDAVVFSSDGAQSFNPQPATDNGDGTYTTTITSSTTVGQPTITATDTATGANGQAILTQTVGPATHVSVVLSSPEIVANGTSTTDATATVTDAAGHRLTGEQVVFASDGAQSFNPQPATDNGDGTYTTTVTSSTAAGQATITATDTSPTPNVSGSATLQEDPGPAASLSLQLSPTSIVADGGSTSTATATVTDAQGNRVAGDTVSFTRTDVGETITGLTDHGDGTYTAQVRSSTTVGQSTITATDTSAPGNVSDQATLTQTAGPATSVNLQLSPTSIVANGAATSTAIAMVSDAEGHPVAGETVGFSSSGAQTFGSVSDHHDGSYTVTITSSTIAGQDAITATDTSVTPSASGQATLTQVPGPATNVAVQVSPPSIIANGTSTSTIKATVTDAAGNPRTADNVVFGSSDPGETISAPVNNQDGTYTAQVRSSTTVGQATITATDGAAHGHATLGQTTGPATVSLTAAPATPVTNQLVTLVATVGSSGTAAPISGTITFANFGSAIGPECTNEPVSSSSPSATCQVSFAAGTSAEQLTAVFTPDANSGVAGSVGGVALSVGGDSTSTSLAVSNPTLNAGGTTTYTATVAPGHAGFVQPSGTVEFVDGATPIAACAHEPLRQVGASLTATCPATYRSAGPHTIVARYSGDRNFSGSSSAQARVIVQPAPVLGTITATMQWSFKFSPSYTRVLTLVVNGAPVGSTVVVACHGHGCPFTRRNTTVTRATRCTLKRKQKCGASHNRTVDLTARFKGRRLSINVQLTVEIIRPNWVGKYYNFAVRSRRGPRIRISCLAPGGTKPGSGC